MTAIWALLLTGCQKPQPESLPPRPALVTVVGKQAAATEMTLAGEIKPRYESSQGFRIAGKIIERKADVGALVKRGQVIARLDPADLALQAAAAQADARSTEANRNLAAAELTRYQQLFRKNFVSASALDIKAAELKNRRRTACPNPGAG